MKFDFITATYNCVNATYNPVFLLRVLYIILFNVFVMFTTLFCDINISYLSGCKQGNALTSICFEILQHNTWKSCSIIHSLLDIIFDIRAKLMLYCSRKCRKYFVQNDIQRKNAVPGQPFIVSRWALYVGTCCWILCKCNTSFIHLAYLSLLKRILTKKRTYCV